MPMLQNRTPPNIPQAPAEYDLSYMNALSNVIRLFFNEINAVQQLNLASLNLDLRTLPTDADLPNLRVGDVYRDTQDGVQATSQMLRIKVPVDLTGVQGLGAVGIVGVTITLSLIGVGSAGAVGTVTP